VEVAPKSLIRRNLLTEAMLSLGRSCDRPVSGMLSLSRAEHPALCRASSRRYASLGLRSKIAGRLRLASSPSKALIRRAPLCRTTIERLVACRSCWTRVPKIYFTELQH
jgi:hypothetical protein